MEETRVYVWGGALTASRLLFSAAGCIRYGGLATFVIAVKLEPLPSVFERGVDGL